MTDTSSSDLMLAILAMDAYNRGYNSSIDLDDIKKIGLATVESDSSDKLSLEETQKIGFYAVSYNLGGKTVISYRGTDNQGIFAKPDKGASDIWSGWSIGAGYANASQATWAKKFYEVVTGHSLGGGLAGYVGALVGAKARALWRSGRGLLLAAVIADLVFLPLGTAHSQDGTPETRKEGTSMTTTTAADRPSIDWFFRERPLPSQFVLPEGEASCAVTKVTATEPILFAERRYGGRVALSVELQAQENVAPLAISQSQTLRAQFYRTASKNLPNTLEDKVQAGTIGTGTLRIPTNENIFVLLCRIGGRYYLSYSLNIG